MTWHGKMPTPASSTSGAPIAAGTTSPTCSVSPAQRARRSNRTKPRSSRTSMGRNDRHPDSGHPDRRINQLGSSRTELFSQSSRRHRPRALFQRSARHCRNVGRLGADRRSADVWRLRCGLEERRHRLVQHLEHRQHWTLHHQPTQLRGSDKHRGRVVRNHLPAGLQRRRHDRHARRNRARSFCNADHVQWRSADARRTLHF